MILGRSYILLRLYVSKTEERHPPKVYRRWVLGQIYTRKIDSDVIFALPIVGAKSAKFGLSFQSQSLVSRPDFEMVQSSEI